MSRTITTSTAPASIAAMRRLCFCIMMKAWATHRQTGRKPSSGRGVYARLSETYDAAESVPTQVERGTTRPRRGWAVAATFKDDGYSGFKEITRDGFGELMRRLVASGRLPERAGQPVIERFSS